MHAVIEAWLSIWISVLAAIGVILTGVLVARWKQWDWLNRLGTFAIIVLVLHVWEEWVVPGGFHYIYNLGSDHPDRYPMSELTDMITNFGAAMLGVVLILWGFGVSAGIAIALFSLFEVIVHVLLAFQSHAEFADAGQSIIYAPGLVTALLGFLVVFIGYLVHFIRSRTVPRVGQWARGLIAIVVGSPLLVQPPELLLKDEDSPYPFPDDGYYEQFLHQS